MLKTFHSPVFSLSRSPAWLAKLAASKLFPRLLLPRRSTLTPAQPPFLQLCSHPRSPIHHHSSLGEMEKLFPVIFSSFVWWRKSFSFLFFFHLAFWVGIIFWTKKKKWEAGGGRRWARSSFFASIPLPSPSFSQLSALLSYFHCYEFFISSLCFLNALLSNGWRKKRSMWAVTSVWRGRWNENCWENISSHILTAKTRVEYKEAF